MRSSFHFISGDRSLSKIEKLLYRSSHLLEKILNTKTTPFPVKTYRPTFSREKYRSAFGDAALDLSSSRVLCLNFLLEHGHKFFGPEKSIADLGCGSGRYANFIKGAHGYRSYIGFDIQENSNWKDREDAQTRFETAVLGVDTIDVTSVDTVFSQSVLEHVREDKSIFHNFRSAAQKSIQHIHLIPAIESYHSYKFHGYRRYGLRTIQNLLNAPGLSEIEIHVLGNGLTRGMFRDHHMKLANKKKRKASLSPYDPSKTMFDNLALHDHALLPEKIEDAEFFILTFRQLLKAHDRQPV